MSTTRVIASFLLILLALPAIQAPDAAAQGRTPAVDVISDAELVFEQALDAFDEGEYGMAYRRFRLVYTSYPLHAKTTAALLMAGKALFRDDRLQDAVGHLRDFVQRYATSSYVGEAERIIALAERRLSAANAQPNVIQLGIALPLAEGDDAVTQAMFNGIRLAVEEHNDRYGPDQAVRMVFRDTHASADDARSAISMLVDEGVDAIIGPLYSDEAEAAADVADRAGTVLLVPLATEESVSMNRRFVFQANPTWTVRGEMLARFADERFGHQRYALMAELGDSYSERMAEGFQEELFRLGRQVLHYRLLEQGSAWYNLDAVLPSTTWDSLEAVYLPITGRDAEQFASAALSALARAGVRPQVFGSAEWADVSALSLASDFNTVYTTNFHLMQDDPAAIRFQEAYRALSGSAPSGEVGRVAYAGYDVARFLITRIMQAGDQPLAASIADAPWYQGVGARFFFNGGNVNRGLFYMRYRPGKVDLLR